MLDRAVANYIGETDYVGEWSHNGKTAEEQYESLEFLNTDIDFEKPSKEEFLSKVEIKLKELLMDSLRKERNIKLAESDWTQNRDVVLANDEEWKTYRQALRDLPQNTVPTSDNIDTLFPTKPSNN